MYLVGIIADNKNIVNVLKNKYDIKKVNFIDLERMENFKNIKFDIILISNLKEYYKNNNFKKIVSNTHTAVINTDIKKNLQTLDYYNGTVITYGFNQKATITASSVDGGNISICIQRVIENIKGQKIEPIEYVESMRDIKNIEISDVIGIKTIESLLTKKKN